MLHNQREYVIFVGFDSGKMEIAIVQEKGVDLSKIHVVMKGGLITKRISPAKHWCKTKNNLDFILAGGLEHFYFPMYWE